MIWRDFVAQQGEGELEGGGLTVKLMFMTEPGVEYSNCTTCNAGGREEIEFNNNKILSLCKYVWGK
jgi:hypothetical protein